jgi:hypothetical protein
MIRPEKRTPSLACASFPLWAGLVFYTALFILFWKYTVDDSFISYRYAESGGRGADVESGEGVEGYSTSCGADSFSRGAPGNETDSGEQDAGLLSGWALWVLQDGSVNTGPGAIERSGWRRWQVVCLAGSGPLSGMETVLYTL